LSRFATQMTQTWDVNMVCDCNHTISLIKSIRHFLIVSHTYALQTQTYTCHISTSYKHVHTQTHIIYSQRYIYKYVCMRNVQTTNLPENLSPSCSQHCCYASFSELGPPKPLRFIIMFFTKSSSHAFWGKYFATEPNNWYSIKWIASILILLMRILYMYIYILVGGLNPSEKY
jgi:hypothetical protein